MGVRCELCPASALQHPASFSQLQRRMCLILFGWNQHPNYRLVLAANRDEFYERPTASADFWEDAPHVLAGRDEKAGGTWMGVTRAGRWAAITNVRDPDRHHPDAPSRGQLVSRYLKGQITPKAYARAVADHAGDYNGFNLLIGDTGVVYYLSNRGASTQPIKPGIHGLSNHLLDTGWPKVERGKKKLRRALERDTLDPERLLDLLHDTERPDDEALPDTGIGLAGERLLSPMFIESDKYGTRSSTVLLIGRDNRITFAERTYDGRTPSGAKQFSFEMETTSDEASTTS